MTNSDLQDLIQQLDKLRYLESDHDQTLSVLKETYMQTPEYQAYQDALATNESIRLEIKDRIEKIHACVLDLYKTTQDKSPHPAVKIRINRKIDYPIGTALDWCKENLRSAFIFDHKFFEKHARAIEGTAPIDFVTFTDEPQVTIASDLSKWSAT